MVRSAAALAALICLRPGATALAQDNSGGGTATTASQSAPELDLTFGPLHLHPRASVGVTADDNLLFTATDQKSDIYESIQPGFQAVLGDDAALVGLRDLHIDPLYLSPGNLVIQSPDTWLGKTALLEYTPRFKFYNQYSTYNAIDEFATLNVLWPMGKLILGFRQDYQLVEGAIIEADRFATSENIDTALSAAYQFGDKTSLESDFRRNSASYDQTGLIGYTEYNTEDWFNYNLTQSLPVSLGVLAGYDAVEASNQDQTYEQLRARARYLLSEKLTFDASVGGEVRQYENGRSDTFTPVFTVTGAYRPTERTTVSLTGYRQPSAAIYNGYNYISTGATLGVSQGITDRFTAMASVGYYTLDYESVTRTVANYTDDYYTARISLDAKILRHLVGQVYYALVNVQSATGGDRDDNQIGVNFTLAY